MCNIDKWINSQYDEISQMSKNITKGHPDSDELLHNCFEQLLDKREQLKNLTDKELKWYFSRILYINWNSSTSPYHYQFRKDFQHSTEIIDDIQGDDPLESLQYKMWMEDKLKEVDVILRDLRWFDRALFQKYFNEGYSYQSLSEKTGINYHTIASTIRRVKKIIKSKITE